MTAVDSPATAVSFDCDVLWICPDTNLWVAQGSGEFLGMVEFAEGHFVSTHRAGGLIDTFSDLPAARRAVVDHASMLDSFADTGKRRSSLRPGVVVADRFYRRAS